MTRLIIFDECVPEEVTGIVIGVVLSVVEGGRAPNNGRCSEGVVVSPAATKFGKCRLAGRRGIAAWLGRCAGGGC